MCVYSPLYMYQADFQWALTIDLKIPGQNWPPSSFSAEYIDSPNTYVRIVNI